MSIPKLIHYCWLSGEPFPEDIQRCIDSWKKYMPDYQIKLWDTKAFDVNIMPYTQQAWEKRKYAFVSDVVRLYALYNEGGIYLDSDIEVFRSFDELLNNKAFTGFESGRRIGAWIFASEKHNPLFKQLLEYYDDRYFCNNDGEMDLTPNTIPCTRTLVERGLLPENKLQMLNDITVYPEEYFCPKNPWTGEINRTENTYAMHLFKGAWNNYADTDLPFISRISEFVADYILYLKKKNISKIVLYGLGVVGKNVLEQLAIQGSDIKIESILVTKLDNGWKEIDGIPIIEIAKSDGLDRDIEVFVSTNPKYHSEIETVLTKNRYRNISFIGKKKLLESS